MEERINMNEKRGTCWVGYQQIGMKKKGNRMVPNCVKEIVDIYWETELGEGCGYTFEFEKQPMEEAEYQGRKVKLNKIMQGDVKKFKVYVKNPKGNVVKVNLDIRVKVVKRQCVSKNQIQKEENLLELDTIVIIQALNGKQDIGVVENGKRFFNRFIISIIYDRSKNHN